MKISRPLDRILDNEAKVKILRFLIKTNAQWNGRQIAKEIGITPATAHKVLHSLFEEGVLMLKNVGKTHIYSLKEDSYIVSSLLKPLFANEEMVLNSIVETIRRKIASSDIKKYISSVVIFGSVNLRLERPTSDIDLAVIIKDKNKRQEVFALFEDIDKKISLEFGNTISPYINTESEFRIKYKNGLGIAKNIVKSNKLIFGKRIESIL